MTFERSPGGKEGTTGAWGCWEQPGIEASVAGVERGAERKDGIMTVMAQC